MAIFTKKLCNKSISRYKGNDLGRDDVHYQTEYMLRNSVGNGFPGFFLVQRDKLPEHLCKQSEQFTPTTLNM